MSTETKKTWWETEFPKLEKEREKRSLKAYEKKQENISKYFALDNLKSQMTDDLFCRERFLQSLCDGFVFEGI